MSHDRSSLASRIRYLAACHEADNRETAILDFFKDDVRHRHFFSGTEVLASGLQDAVALPASTGLPALEEARVYRRERSLAYGCFFVTGRALAAPLLTFPAELHPHGEDSVVLRITPTDPAWNLPLMAEVAGESPSERLEDFARRLPSHPFTDGALAELAGLLSELFPPLELEALHEFPRLVTERVVRSRRGGALTCLPAAAMALVENPRSSRGILSELARVADAEALSPPIRALFHATEPPPGPGLPSLASVPAVLSRPQQKVLRSARRNALTLIVGPPGTGKSYTVSALALEHVARGESVLVACRTEQALDVIEKKLEAMLGESTPVLRGGSRDYARKLKESLTRLLSGQLENFETEPLGALEKKLARLEKRLLAIEHRIEEHHRLESAWGELAGRGERLGIGDGLRRRWLEWRLAGRRPSWELVLELERRDAERVALASRLVQASRALRIEKLLESHRADLKKFSAAVRARTSSRQETLFSEIDLGVLLDAFPLWVSTFRDLHRFVPFAPELFDLIVIDEATQSDMASPLPALFRAKRAAVTGDHRQLRHVSFLSRDRQRRLGEEAGLLDDDVAVLDYREKSLLDLVDDGLASQEQVAFLDEHYRSTPSIIDFSNREFYGGDLRIMTSRPGALDRSAVELRLVEGYRDENGVNAVEADALLAEVLTWVERESGLPAGSCHSFGILSPFRDQADHILGLATERLGLASIEKHDLLVGTAYGFQGEERDVMFLSLAVDRNSHPQALRHVNQLDVFNVAITRARARQLVFTSIAAADCPKDSLLARYLAAAGGLGVTAPALPPRDEFLEAVAKGLAARGLPVHRAFVAGGMTIDLVVELPGRALGIDLVGNHGPYAASMDVERYRMFRRAGLSIVPLTYAAWRRDPEAALEAIVGSPGVT